MGTEWQWHYLTRDYVESATNASTLRIKLPKAEQISCIEVECRAQIDTPNYNYKVIDMLEKLEVIADGSKVLYSCIPEVASFLHLTQIGQLPNHLNIDYAGMYDHFRVKICFGRWQRDEEYGLDTSLYNNVYLEIPWELDTTYYTTHTFAHTIRYLRPIEKLPWVGFIRSRDIEYDQHAWTATGHYFVDLPLKYPWYMLGCRIYNIAYDLVDLIPHIKLDIDDGRLVLVDDDTDDLITVNTERLLYPIHTEWKKKALSAGGGGGYVRAYMGRPEQVNAVIYPTGDGDQLEISSLTGQRVDIWPVTSAGAATTGDANISIWGNTYMCCLIIKDWFAHPRFPQPMEPFPVAEHSEANIDYEHGAYTVTDLRTFLQEVCPLGI